MQILLVTFFLGLAPGVMSVIQQEWARQYGDASYNHMEKLTFDDKRDFLYAATNNRYDHGAQVDKFQPNGDLVWTYTPPGAGNASDDVLRIDDISVGSHIYFTSVTNASGVHLTKVSKAGEKGWDVSLVPPSHARLTKTLVATYWPTHHIFALTTIDQPMDGAALVGKSDVALMKISKADGSKVWTKTFGWAEDDWAVALAVDPQRHVVYICLDTFEDHSSVGLIAVNADTGDVIWQRTFGGQYEDYAKAMTVDRRNGDVYITGETAGYFYGEIGNGDITQTDGFVIKTSASGDRSWSKLFFFNTDEYVFERGVSIDINPLTNNVLVLHKDRNWGTSTQAAIQSFDMTNGTIDESLAINAFADHLTVNGRNGDVYVGGSISSQYGDQQAFGDYDALILKNPHDVVRRSLRGWLSMIPSVSLSMLPSVVWPSVSFLGDSNHLAST